MIDRDKIYTYDEIQEALDNDELYEVAYVLMYEEGDTRELLSCYVDYNTYVLIEEESTDFEVHYAILDQDSNEFPHLTAGNVIPIELINGGGYPRYIDTY